MLQVTCHHCAQASTFSTIARSTECAACGRDIKVCFNCIFYEESHFHACREPQAEWVREKDKSNFCEYFSPTTREKSTQADNLLSKLEDLFR